MTDQSRYAQLSKRHDTLAQQLLALVPLMIAAKSYRANREVVIDLLYSLTATTAKLLPLEQEMKARGKELLLDHRAQVEAAYTERQRERNVAERARAARDLAERVEIYRREGM